MKGTAQNLPKYCTNSIWVTLPLWQQECCLKASFIHTLFILALFLTERERIIYFLLIAQETFQGPTDLSWLTFRPHVSGQTPRQEKSLPIAPGPTGSCGMNNLPVFSMLQVPRGVSCLLFIIGLLCTGRQARPSLTTLCKWVREMKIKPVQQEPLGAGVLLAKAWPRSSLGAT